MKKKFYNEPEIEVISYALEDVIKTSNLAVDEIVPGEDGDDFVWGAPF